MIAVTLFIMVYFWAGAVGSVIVALNERKAGDILGETTALLAYFLFFILGTWLTCQFARELFPRKPRPSPKPKI